MASGHDSRRRGGTFVDVDLAGLVRIQDFEGLLEARRVQEERQVVLAARREEPDHRLVASDGVDAAGGSRGKRRVASMAYDEPPQTLRTARAAAPSPRRARVEGRTQRADISCLDSDPPWSLSMSWKHSRAAFLNSNVNSSISLLAALASSSRAFWRCSSLAASAVSIASSLRGTSTS